jgi:hypothetical protein
MSDDPTSRTDRGIARLAADIALDSSRLVRLEIERAKAEVVQQAATLGGGIGLIAGGVFLLLVAVPILVASLVLGIAEFLPAWLSALLVGLLLVAVAALLAGIGVQRTKRGAQLSPTTSIDAAREDLEWLTRRPASKPTSTS